MVLSDLQMVKNLAAEVTNNTLNIDVTELINEELPLAKSKAMTFAPTIDWDTSTNPTITTFKLYGAYRSLYITICAMQILRRLGIYNQRVENWNKNIQIEGKQLSDAATKLAKADLDDGHDKAYGFGFSGAENRTYPSNLSALPEHSIQFLKHKRGKRT